MRPATSSTTKRVPRLERETRIVTSATKLFGGNGYARTSVQSIADEAGISKALILSYFGSKDGLHLRCVRDAGEALIPAITGVVATSPPQLMAFHTLRCIFQSLQDRRYDWKLLHDVSAPENTEGGHAAAEYRAAIRHLAADGTFALLGANGPVDPVDREILTDVWLNILDALVAWFERNIDTVTSAEMVQRCITFTQTVASLGNTRVS